MDELNELNALCEDLTNSIKEAKKYGIEKANAEFDYKVALRQEALILRRGEMPVTLIDKVVYGENEVAKKRKERDIAESNYRVELERINVLKVRIRVLENQINKEY